MKRFVSSYQGEADYDVDGIRFRVRTFALPNSSIRDELKQIERDEVGTVRAKDWPSAGEFPPASVMAEFPGYQAARYASDDNYTVKYNGSKPATFTNHMGWLEVKL